MINVKLHTIQHFTQYTILQQLIRTHLFCIICICFITFMTALTDCELNLACQVADNFARMLECPEEGGMLILKCQSTVDVPLNNKSVIVDAFAKFH